MRKYLIELYQLLTAEQRKRLVRLQVLVILMSFSEVAGVMSIAPFMTVVGDLSYLKGNGILAQVYGMSGLTDPKQFLFWLSIVFLFVLSIAAAISTFTTWRLSLYGQQVGAELSSRLFRYYMYQSWLFHAGGNSAQLINKIYGECNRVTGRIIIPLLLMASKTTMAIIMGVAIFILEPSIALASVILFLGAYLILYSVVRRFLLQQGKLITDMNRERIKLMNEGFGGIKDTLLLGRQAYFNKRFTAASQLYGRAQGLTVALSQVPRFGMELIAFGGIIVLILYLLSEYQGEFSLIMPVLSIYALAGFKLLPAFQQIYASASQLRANLPAFETIRNDLIESQYAHSSVMLETADHLDPLNNIQLSNVTVTYPGKLEPALSRFNMTIPSRKLIGLVGASGSGKSTAIDVLLGLIEPDQGELSVDGEAVTKERKRAWQNSIGYVPQTIFLSDGSVRENIAFGLPEELVDEDRVTNAATMAHLDELLRELPEGLDTRVGERGVQLSGGQRQRIGIARALYHDASVLVLDEATSALDGVTEKMVMDAIHSLLGKKTIIMIAHRLATVKQCDIIYLMQEGRVIDNGSFKELNQNNIIFRTMAEHA